jgi:hypothetical protein
MKLACTPATLLAILPSTAFASMFSMPSDDLAIGPSVAYLYGPEHGIGFNFDTAYTNSIFAASLNLKYDYFPERKLHLYGPQAEFTAWLLVTFGGGAGYLLGDEHGPVLHAFVGFPIGDDFLPKSLEPFQTGYIEPYVRTNFFFPHGLEFCFEGGLMFKMTTYTL